ncbi:hypothetical protein JYK02_38265 [Corallococcus macrosporus]|uniref:JmjC domain-containing protein n=1 Tax=Corallococcus macrosporus TaxID=35 RepID=A0ABS3DPZ1_9BACT|nr:cupin domain-containing protein [Corallococcus macrosporus]MBN8233379.1 hypothetical protein [Corallococcus macrosporus]
MPDLSALEFILHPMSVEVFLSEYWEKKVLHIPRNRPDYYSHLFSLGELDSFLGHSMTNDEVRMARSGSVTHPNVEGDNKTTLYQFYERYRDGHTIVIRNIHQCWPPVGEIANALARAFGCYISTFSYATPENAQGFKTHWDDHDIFALQLEGEKEWRLYDSGPELPRYSKERGEYERQSKPADGPSHVINLKAGDLLYFPKGVIHEPRTRTCSSLHVTFGLFPDTWEKILTESVMDLADRDPRFQESLPFGYSVEKAHASRLFERAQELAEEVSGAAHFEASRNRLAAKFLDRIAPLADGHFSRLGSGTQVHAGTPLERRRSMEGVVLAQGGKVKLHFPGGHYLAARESEAALRFVAMEERFLAGDIPGRGEPERLALVRDLIQVGFLKVAEPKGER